MTGALHWPLLLYLKALQSWAGDLDVAEFAEENVYLAQAVSVAAYQRGEIVRGEDIVRGGALINNYSAHSVARCPDGQERSGLICYPLCREGYHGVGPRCWKKLQSYSRGIGERLMIFYKYEPRYDVPVCGHENWTVYKWESQKGQQFIIISNAELKLTVFGFRGTKPTNSATWKDNAKILPKELTWSEGGKRLSGKVHKGVYVRWSHVKQKVKDQLENVPGDHRVIITGHSLGAAIAFLAAPYFSEWGRPADAVIAFASLRMGDRNFANVYKTKVGCEKTLHIYDGKDLVPKVPAHFRMPCVGKTISTKLDTIDAHNLTGGVQNVIEHFYGPMPTEHSASCYKDK